MSNSYIKTILASSSVLFASMVAIAGSSSGGVGTRPKIDPRSVDPTEIMQEGNQGFLTAVRFVEFLPDDRLLFEVADLNDGKIGSVEQFELRKSDLSSEDQPLLSALVKSKKHPTADKIGSWTTIN